MSGIEDQGAVAQKRQPGFADAAKILIRLAVATPAAVGVFGMLSERLQLDATLARIVNGYAKISKAIWDAVFATLHLAVPVSHLTLSVISLTAIPSVVYVVWALTTPRTRTDAGIWPIVNILSAIILAIVFRSGTVIAAAAAFFILAPVITVLVLGVIQRVRVDTIGDAVWLGIVMIVCSVGCYLLVTYVAVAAGLLIDGSVTLSPGSWANWRHLLWSAIIAYALIAVPAACVLIASAMGARSAAYALAVAAGIAAFNWAIVVGKPWLDSFLTSVGA